ncbi:DUF424 family protein [Candidatus Micrarchaeota archaeon]|nr:DUF424 family protein [Candidatus Micrarchaeota archaeon]
MYCKIHESKKERVLALCDAELLGKILREGEATLDLQSFRSFYEGEKVNASRAEKELKNCTSANLVGKKSVATAVKAKIIAGQENVKTIQGIPHLQIYRIRE